MGVICSTLAGTLQRHDDGSWRWSDDTPEPRVHDLSRNGTYNFRVRSYGGPGQRYIEVLRQQAENEPDLQWVLAAHAVGSYRLDQSGGHMGPLVIDEDGPRRMAIRPGEDPIEDETVPDRKGIPIPRVILVPMEDWDRWVRTAPPLGAEWDREHEADILSRARALGWSG